MSVKSFSEFNHDRFVADGKKRRLKENKANRAKTNKRLRDIDIDEEYDDDFETFEKFRNM